MLYTGMQRKNMHISKKSRLVSPRGVPYDADVKLMFGEEYGCKFQ